MLVLTRRQGESILLYPSKDVDPNMTVAELFKDGVIKITTAKISVGQVRIAIDAPNHLAILRDELEEK